MPRADSIPAKMQHETFAPRTTPSHARTRVVRQLLNQALRQLADFDRADRAACAHYIAQALRIHRESTEGRGEWRQGGGLASWQVQVVKELALTRLDTPLAVAELAAACNLSRGYFSRAFKATFGESPHRWRHGKRLEQACQRLVNSNETIADIAIAFGFNDQAHFTRAFKSALGITPNVYRRRGNAS